MNRNQVQNDAVTAFLKTRNEHNRCRGTIECITGLGKTFISLFAIQELNPKSVLFLAETTLREAGIREDIIKFKEMFGYDCFNNRTIEFACYQSAYKWVNKYHEMVIADEIHDSLTPQYFKYYENNSYTHLIGLSATIDKKTIFKMNDVEYTKIELLNKIAPICFTYSLRQGQEDGTSRKLTLSIIEHTLDDRVKSIPVTYKDKLGKQQTFYQTEQQAYDYCHKRYLQSMYSGVEFLIHYWRNKRNSLLYKLPSKTQAVISLLSSCNFEKTIVFGNDILELNKICPTVSSKNRKETNDKLIEDFNEGRLNTIGSFKMLKQGINLKDLNNVVIHSYYSVEKDFIQRVGRLRWSKKKGNVVIFMTKNTQEEAWMNKIREDTKLEFNRYKLIRDYVQHFNNKSQS